MKRGLRARRNAQAAKAGKSEKTNTPDPVFTIQSTDVETGEVVETFDSFAAAVEAGYSLPNLKGAVKNGTKYKGHLWSTVE